MIPYNLDTVELSTTPQEDTSSPGFGGVLSAEPVESASVLVSWNAATDDLTPDAGLV